MALRHEGAHRRRCWVRLGATVMGTAANEHDITQTHALLHGEEKVVFVDSGYRGITRREEIKRSPHVDWQVP